MRRLLDILVAILALIALSPFFALIGLAIKLEDGGPVFYSQTRLGRGFRKFRLYKFRSMTTDADRLGPPLTAPSDPRITRVGRFLRRSKLDELPQLVNLLRGDMRLVGARPELERYVEMFRPEYTLLLQDRPGITDPASLAYRHEHLVLGADGVEKRYVTEILPHKLSLSLDYAGERNFLSDLGIVVRTLLGLPWTPHPSERSQSAGSPDTLPAAPAKSPNISTKIPS
ncbi:MAG TPA: sugar transferase [Terriglobia bacterium]|nr:sugar transferase [Terriglobia bacterium]